MKNLLLILFFIVFSFASCKHTENNLTQKIIKEEILKTKQQNNSQSKSLEQIDSSLDSIKNKDLPEINHKNDK